MTDKNKANIADLLAYAMAQSDKATLEKQTRELAHGVKALYDGFRTEGFNEEETMHLISVILSSAAMSAY